MSERVGHIKKENTGGVMDFPNHIIHGVRDDDSFSFWSLEEKRKNGKEN